MVIGMPEAARRLGLSRSDSAKRALENAGVPLVKIDERTWTVEEADLEAFLQQRSSYTGIGRPRKQPEESDDSGGDAPASAEAQEP